MYQQEGPVEKPSEDHEGLSCGVAGMTLDGEAAVSWQGISKVPNREKMQIPAHFFRLLVLFPPRSLVLFPPRSCVFYLLLESVGSNRHKIETTQYNYTK